MGAERNKDRQTPLPSLLQLNCIFPNTLPAPPVLTEAAPLTEGGQAPINRWHLEVQGGRAGSVIPQLA